MREKRIVFFIIVMVVLCSFFLLGFIYRPGGSQRSVFFHEATEYMADYYNVAKFSALRNPYCYGEEDPTPEEHAYQPPAYMISYVLSRFSDYANLPAAAAWGSPTGLLSSFFFVFFWAFRLMIYGIIAFFAPFLFFKGGFHNLPVLLHNLQLNSVRYTELVFPRFNFRFWVQQICARNLRRMIYRVFPLIDGILSALAVALAAFQSIRWKRDMLLLLVLVILPVNSAEYTGLYLLIGVVLFLNEETVEKLDWIYLVLMILFLNPFQLIVRGINLTQYGVNLSVSIMLLVLLADSAVGLLRSRRKKHDVKVA